MKSIRQNLEFYEIHYVEIAVFLNQFIVQKRVVTERRETETIVYAGKEQSCLPPFLNYSKRLPPLLNFYRSIGFNALHRQ